LPLIVFDLDGTLIDSQQDLAAAANALIEEHGGHPLPVEAVAAMVGEGAAVLVRRALTAAGVTADIERALARFLELYDERLLDATTLYDGIAQALDDLAAAAPLAVLTNKPLGATTRLLDGLGIADKFQWTLGGDSPFGRKPDPAGLRHLMAAASVSPAETLLIGDSAIDLATARAAGVRLCVARYGFGFRIPSSELREADLIADHPAAIVPLVLEHFL
jgi:phosphoglycolate phosphatase